MYYQLKKSPTGFIGLAIIIIFVIVAFLAPIISPFDPSEQNLTERLHKPIWGNENYSSIHILGTDQLGRDVLSRIIYGSRISISVSLCGTIFGLIFGTIMGAIAGYFGKFIDTIISRIIDIQLSFPFMLIAIFVASTIGPGIINIIIVAGITSWVRFARIARAEVLNIKNLEYITATRALGGKNIRIILNHILPNIISPIIVIASLEVSKIVLMEASLSFLGLGVPPQIPTWGRMLAQSITYLQTASYLAVIPGIAITLLVLSLNLFGDWLRDYLDPKIAD